MSSCFSAKGSHFLSMRKKYIGLYPKVVVWMGHRPLCWRVNHMGEAGAQV